jgi:uncharacterized membrane protein YdfJ with MMPL/SSD domain
MAAQTDFWGELVPAQERTPLAILREQASLLGTKTKNLVEATVDTSVTPNGRFAHRFTLVVPSLSNYKYELFRIEHGVASYPITVASEVLSAQSGPGLTDQVAASALRSRLLVTGSLNPQLETEQEFVDWLRHKLSSDETKRIIANLLAQATS